MPPEELSPAKGVPTPGEPGALGTDFLSDCPKSAIFTFQSPKLEEA